MAESSADLPQGAVVLIGGVPYQRYENGLFGSLQMREKYGVLSPRSVDEIGYQIVNPTVYKKGTNR